MTQTIFTIITEVEPAKVDALDAVLSDIGADPATNSVLSLAPFDELHFASLTRVDKADLEPTLIFEHNVDGSVDEWLGTLVGGAREGLEAIYANCVGCPASGDGDRLRAYLRSHVVHPGAFHIGATGRSRAQINEEAALHGAIQAFLESDGGRVRFRGSSPEAVRAAVQAFVRSRADLSWAQSTPPRQTPEERRGHRRRLAKAIAAAVVASPVLVPVAAMGLAVLRLKELTDPVQKEPPDPVHVRALSDTEDFVAQNHLASVITVKPGLLRAVTLPLVLYVLNLVARVSYTKGELGGIPSIHFAHWSVFDRGRQLLFLSNFDGSWESYLGDFIDKAAVGLTAVWSNTVNFPRTRFIAFDGATDGPRFRQWARSNQCKSQVWYSAYPRSTMPMIDNNTAIREGLFASLRGGEVRAWLQRL